MAGRNLRCRKESPERSSYTRLAPEKSGLQEADIPTLVRWYIKAALVYLIASLVLGILLAIEAIQAWLPGGLTPVYLHMLVVGWLSQLIFGVAIWMFPKYSQAQPRGPESLGWAAFILLNAGLLLRVVGEPLVSHSAQAGWLLAVSAVFQWLGGVLFAANAWPRVKAR